LRLFPLLSHIVAQTPGDVQLPQLANWVNALGRDVEIIVKSSPRTRGRSRLRVIEAA
jgi:hypothetical protein